LAPLLKIIWLWLCGVVFGYSILICWSAYLVCGSTMLFLLLCFYSIIWSPLMGFPQHCCCCLGLLLPIGGFLCLQMDFRIDFLGLISVKKWHWNFSRDCIGSVHCFW
jgi:hypothetical protein